jgi:CRP/FNR family transcriptional regulator, cyclic AMP receptor protein
MASKPKRGLAPVAFLKQPGDGRTIRLYRNKEVIYAQGHPADAVFYVQSGMVKLTIASKQNRKKAALALLQEGDLFGEGCLGKETARTSSATSMGPSTGTRLKKATFRRKMDRDPEFASIVITCLLSRIDRLQADLADHFFNFSERRLARLLLTHACFAGKSPLILRISQATLAEMVGTTRSRVSRFMNKFREKGYVRYNGGMHINPGRLTAFLRG